MPAASKLVRPPSGKAVRGAVTGKRTAAAVASANGHVKAKVAKHGLPLSGQISMFGGGQAKQIGKMRMSATRAAARGAGGQMALPGLAKQTRKTTKIARAAKGSNFKRNAIIAGVVAGGLALNGMRNSSGRSVDPVRGRPTGIYGY